MNEPYVSPDFNMDDIRRIRDYNAMRYEKMTREEIIADINAGAEECLRKMEAYKKKKELGA